MLKVFFRVFCIMILVGMMVASFPFFWSFLAEYHEKEAKENIPPEMQPIIELTEQGRYGGVAEFEGKWLWDP